MNAGAKGNLFLNASPPSSGERIETLLTERNLVIERIVSSGDTEPTRYVQTQDEWVLLAQGTAALSMNGDTIQLTAGDYVFIPANVPHTLERTSDGALWLAVHLHQAQANSGA